MNNQRSLVQLFIDFNRGNRLAGPKKQTLLAVSGGMDSVAMCALFQQAGWPFAIAHCNFQLRGEEADADEHLVRELAKQYQTPLHVQRFDTAAYAAHQKVSIQVAARELRYSWFQQLCQAHHYPLVATAHQLNDNIETILFNLVKGTGIRGLRGIPVRQGYIIRPLLFASRDRIAAFCHHHQLAFREDSSNAEDKYTRNKIRHHVIPLLKEINPSLEKTWSGKIALFTELERVYERHLKKQQKRLFLPRNNDIVIPLQLLKKTQNASSVLYEFLKDLEFTPEQIQAMLGVIDEAPGRQFLTSKARIIKDRKFFIVTQLPEKDITFKQVNESEHEVMLDGHKLQFTKHKASDVSNIEHRTSNIEYLDAEKLDFPLTLRRWKPGDYFYPIGMHLKKKKVKKFLTDAKVPLHEKEKVWVLQSNQRIAWIVGHRLDERFKVTEKTKQIIRFEWR